MLVSTSEVSKSANRNGVSCRQMGNAKSSFAISRTLRLVHGRSLKFAIEAMPALRTVDLWLARQVLKRAVLLFFSGTP